MGHEQEKLNERIRKTIADMRDEDLIQLVQSPHGEYTAFARKAARREVARRGGLEALRRNVSEGRSAKTPREPEYVRAPKEKVPSAGVASGCYIDVWQDESFQGDSFRIEGPGEIPDLCADGMAWCGRIRSLRVGPTAFVLAYAAKQFKGDMIRLGPGEEIPDLANVKFEDEIDSMRIVDSVRVFDCTCSPHEDPQRQVASDSPSLGAKEIPDAGK